MAGTITYMAPEQIQGKPRPASDQYALGIVVYEWISGDRPFHGSLAELVGQHLAVSPPSLQEKVSMILPKVDQVVMRALAKDPKERFASIQAFASALEQASESTQIQASASPHSFSPSSHAATIPPPGQVSQTIDAATPSTTPQKPSQQTLMPARNTQTIQPKHSTAKTTLNERFSRRKVVATIVGTGVGIGTGAIGIYWWNFSKRSTVQSRPTIGGPVYSAAWSPDGKYIASSSDDMIVQVWTAPSSKAV